MNIFHFIQQDHHEIDSLLSRLQLAPDAADFDQAGRRYLLDRLLTEIEGQADADDQLLGSVLREVSVHDAIERQYLHPAIRRRLPDGNARYQQLTSELGQIGRLAAKLDIYHFHDEARAAWVRELTVNIRNHIEQEEAAILPALPARMTHEELVDLGERLETATVKAPTRPHPHISRGRHQCPVLEPFGPACRQGP
jgi:hypothetical protein